jgi:hypothetical protein
VSGGWVAAALDAYGTALELAAEPRHATPVEAQAAADERAFALACQGAEVVRRADGSWTVTPVWCDSPVRRLVVFEAAGPQTVFPRPAPPPEPRCQRYQAGHRVHYIQARLSLEHGGGVPCEVVEVIDPDVVIIGFGKARRRWHNHDLGALRAAQGARGAAARIDERRNLLRLGNRVFCIARPEDWVPACDIQPRGGSLFRPDPPLRPGGGRSTR